MTAPLEPENPSELFTPFLPSTYNVPKEDDRLDVFLVDKLSVFADVINQKKIGTIVQAAENFNGDTYFYRTTQINRNGYHALAYIPSLPNSGVLVLTRDTDPQYPVPNVNEQFVISDLWGTASLPPTATGAGDGDFIKFNNRGDPRIFFDMSDTTITLTTTVDLSSYIGLIFVTYIRNGL